MLVMSNITVHSKEPSTTVLSGGLNTSGHTKVEKGGDLEDSSAKENKLLQEIDKNPELDDTVNGSQEVSQALLLAIVGVQSVSTSIIRG